MKHPVMKIGQFEFHYVQIPYDDRYYVIKFEKGGYGKKEIAKFSPAVINFISDMINLAVMKVDGAWNATRKNQVDKFFGNKERYDAYLDNQDDIAFNKLKAKERLLKKKKKK